jgi:hypothetical protein
MGIEAIKEKKEGRNTQTLLIIKVTKYLPKLLIPV